MKHLLILTFFIAYLSCTDSDSKKSDTVNLFPTISDNNKIYGPWIMCANSSGGTLIQRNVCPIITFYSSGIGQISINDVVTERFQWKLKKNQLKIFYAQANPNSIFSDTSYYINFDTTSKPGLELTVKNNNSEYYLSSG